MWIFTPTLSTSLRSLNQTHINTDTYINAEMDSDRISAGKCKRFFYYQDILITCVVAKQLMALFERQNILQGTILTCSFEHFKLPSSVLCCRRCSITNTQHQFTVVSWLIDISSGALDLVACYLTKEVITIITVSLSLITIICLV